jgi:xanthine dehydrogenase accessory factor
LGKTVLDFYQTLATELAQHSVVVATVVAISGSAPREVGAKMIICADGRIIGTIGGGAGEAKVYAQALAVLRSGDKQFVEIDLSGIPDRDTQGVCGGTMKVWIERWELSALVLVQEIIARLKDSMMLAIVTPFSPNDSPRLCFDIIYTIQVTDTSLIEPLHQPPTLVIIGAGHVAIPLAQAANLTGFQVVVVDDRLEFANPQRFPQAAQVLAQPTAIALSALPLNLNLYAALVTRGLQHDLDALKVLLHRPTQYIGMIGSQKRGQLVRQTLLQQGYAVEKLDQLYAPIGLDIGALTPEEIAISITAELIKVRRGGTGNSLARRAARGD